jgi:tetrahydromethanopterin S-methyltransferase subunit C
MEKHFHKSSGISLITGSLLIIATMGLHPTGGSIEYIIKITKSITATHSLAIFSLPLLFFGFYGLTNALLDKWKLAKLGLIIMGFGLIAAMFAALINGLTLPYFLGKYENSIAENADMLKLIINYGFAINKPLDYIFIIATCLAITIYSLLIVSSNKLPKWIGYFGISLILFAIIGLLTGFVFSNLIGFQIFIFGIATWFLATGISLIKSK